MLSNRIRTKENWQNCINHTKLNQNITEDSNRSFQQTIKLIDGIISLLCIACYMYIYRQVSN